MGKVTLQAIANELGVSKGTVNRFIDNNPDVSLSIRQKMLELKEIYKRQCY